MQKKEEVSYHIKTAKTKNSKAGKVLDIAYKRVTKRSNGKISISNISEDGSDIVHPDLIKSLKAFLPHFLILGEIEKISKFQGSYFKEEKFNKEPNTYEVTGIHIKEINEKRFVIMVGRHNLKTGRVISMTIPMVCFEPLEEDEDAYALHEELASAVDNYLSEVEQFLGGKVGESDQQEMNFESNEEEVPEEDPDEEDQDPEEKPQPKKTKLKKVS